MVESDLSQVNLILSKAFSHARLQNGLSDSRVPPCKIEFLKMYLAGNPSGAFVIERNERILAYCFSRLWGSVGWIGPLSVLPAEEGRGYGKQIVGAALEALKSAGAKTIGLEMPAHSFRNLAFYTKLGFCANELTVDLVRDVSRFAPPPLKDNVVVVKMGDASPSEKPRYFDDLRELSNRLQPGLDYSREVQLANDFDFGDGRLVYCNGSLIGFILAHTEIYSQEESREYLKVNALQLAPDLELDRLGLLIELMEDWARFEGLASIYLRVPLRYHDGFRFLLSQNFFAVHNELRMTLEGFPQLDDSRSINFNKWE
jgi:GNAT superfamily N-acetyltransferase